MNTDFEEIKMDIFIPLDIESSIQKSQDEDGGENWYVRGFASTPDLDLQGDIVQPSGINIDYFVQYGWLNYEHQQDAKYAVGAPTQNCYVDFQKGLFVEAILFKDNEYAQEMWKLANSVDKSGTGRKLGFSIEGGIRKRNSKDNRIIEELVIKNVALTKSPANPHATWEYFMKSWTTGHAINPSEMTDGAALRRESLGQAITQLSYAYSVKSPLELTDLWTDVSKYLDQSKKVTPEVATVLLQVAKGLSREDAQAFVTKMYTERE